jgi:hypothetical protein
MVQQLSAALTRFARNAQLGKIDISDPGERNL